METPALVARVDDDAAAPVGNCQAGEGFDGQQRGERGVPVVRRASTVEPIALAHGLERSQARSPFPEGGLLVEVSIDEDRTRVGSGLTGGNLHEQRGGAVGNL